MPHQDVYTIEFKKTKSITCEELEFIKKYILTNRFERYDIESQWAVGSAIRTYIRTLPFDQFDTLPEIASDNEHHFLSDSLHVEFTKQIYRSFIFTPPTECNKYQNLSSYLLNLAVAYKNPMVFDVGKISAAYILSVLAYLAIKPQNSLIMQKHFSCIFPCAFGWANQYTIRHISGLAYHWQEKNYNSFEWLMNSMDACGIEIVPEKDVFI